MAIDYSTNTPYSITFGSYNTWEKWKLIPTTKPIVNPPEPNTKLEKVSGMSGYLDYTYVLSDSMTYADREGEWEFIIHSNNGNSDWFEIYNDILSKLNGKYFDSIILSQETYYKYTGRITVSELEDDTYYSKVKIKYRLDPFKRPATSDAKRTILLYLGPDDVSYPESTLYSSSDLYPHRVKDVDEIIYPGNDQYLYSGFYPKEYKITESIVNESDYNINSTIEVSNNVYVQYNHDDSVLLYNYNKGSNIGPTLYPGINKMTFIGQGTIKLEYYVTVSM